MHLQSYRVTADGYTKPREKKSCELVDPHLHVIKLSNTGGKIEVGDKNQMIICSDILCDYMYFCHPRPIIYHDEV